jgi:hypothetical protein
VDNNSLEGTTEEKFDWLNIKLAIIFVCFQSSYNTAFLAITRLPGNVFVNGIMFGFAEFCGIFSCGVIASFFYDT